MSKFYAKIIATDNEGLEMISACCAGAKIKVSDIKFLKSNKVFLLSMERQRKELDNKNQKINSICKFDFVDNVKAKNINQKKQDKVLELLAINFLKNTKSNEIDLIFNDNAHISLITETIEVRLEDQNGIK